MEEFLAHRRADGYTLWLSAKAMVPMLGYLRGLGVVVIPAPTTPATEAEGLQEHYRAYLVEERGLAPGTVVGYLHVARLFFRFDPLLGILDATSEALAGILRPCNSDRTPPLITNGGWR